MIKRILSLTIALLAVTSIVKAQESGTKIFLAPTISYNSYISVEAPEGNLANYEAVPVSASFADKKLMVGFEGGIMAGPLRVSVGGGFNTSNTPGRAELPGTATYSSYGDIPNYRAVASSHSVQYTVSVGGDFCFSVGQNLKPFIGLRARGSYGNNQKEYDEVTSMGKSTVEAWNIGGAIDFGGDYIFAGGLFVGVQFDLFSYTYGGISYIPQPGLAKLSAENCNIGVLSSPTLKIGICF